MEQSVTLLAYVLTLFVIIVVLLRFEVFTAGTIKNAVLWNVTPCGSCKKPSFRRNLAPS
jgi:hypothetical protein